MENETVHKLPLFFILGRPRSGTTLLRTLFDAHPGVKIPVEYPIIFDIYNKFKHVTKWDEKNLDRLYQAITGKRIYDFWRFENLKIDPEEFRRHMNIMVPKHGLSAVFSLLHYLSWSAFSKDKILALGDKNPVYSLFISDLLELFPEARFICLVRDPRDTFVSMRKFEFEAPNAAIQAWRWRYIMHLFLEKQKKFPSRILITRYEDLVTHPEQEFGRMCAFLDIPYHADVFRYLDKKDEILHQYSDALVERYQKSLLEPITGNKIGRWKEDLSPHEIATIEHISNKYISSFHYEPSGISASAGTRLVIPFWGIYSNLLYGLMKAGNRLPWWISQPVATFLPALRKVYMLFSRNNR